MPPLTHHEILELVQPFARRGRPVDLPACRRAERQIVFKPVLHAAVGPDQPALLERLQLDSLGTGTFRLTRLLSRDDGLQATLQASGAAPDELLARIEAVPLAQQFCAGPGWQMARCYEFESVPASAAGAAPTLQRVLSRGLLRLDGLSLQMSVPCVRGVSADFTLTPAPGENLALPEDLLAVIGWDWARLVPNPNGWTSKLRLRGQGERRCRTAEQALDKLATHLAQTLAEPPARFHQRHFWARWGVVLRRLIPTLTAVGLVAGVLLLPRLAVHQDPGFWLALHYVPIGLLAFSFCLQELPRFEIPPWPRRSKQAAWRQPLQPGAAPPAPAPAASAAMLR